MIDEVHGVNRLAQRGNYLVLRVTSHECPELASQIPFATRVVGHWRVTDPNGSFALTAFRNLESQLVLYLQRALRGRHRARVDDVMSYRTLR